MTVERLPSEWSCALPTAAARTGLADRPLGQVGPCRRPRRGWGAHGHLFTLGCVCAVIGSLGIPVSAAAPSIQTAWHDAQGYRWRELKIAPTGHTGFTRLSGDETGLVFTNTLTELAGALNRVLYNGSGVAVGDYDGDGRPDLYFCGLNTSNVLFRNLGEWRFEPVPSSAGIVFPDLVGRGAVFADINGDGWNDLLVSTLAQGVRCYLNTGDGRFTDFTREAGTASDGGSTSLALADVDGNGTLDLYITNYRPSDIRDRGEVTMRVVGGEVVPPPEYRDRLTVIQGAIYEYGQPDQLLLNDGHGRFAPVGWDSGMFLDEAGETLSRPPRDWGLTATFRDINGDGLPDLYVCNDYWTPDRVWYNQGQGQFRAIAPTALRNTSASSMGLDLADVDRDGDLDCFVLDMFSRDPRFRLRQKLAQMPPPHEIGVVGNRPQVMRNTLQENRGDGTFREVAWHAGVPASDWSWSAVFLDVDLDGFEDLLISAGHFKDVQDMDVNMLIKVRQRPRDPKLSPEERHRRFTQELLEHHRLYPRLEMPVVAFRNRGDGTFEESTDAWGTEELGVHHSIATGDFDLDGDLDLVTNNLDTNAGLYRNESTAPRVAVQLRGHPPNTQAIGAVVRLLGGAVPMQLQEVVSGGRYLAGCESLLVFAAGLNTGSMTLEITWRSGRRAVVNNVQANRLYEVQEPESAPIPRETPPTTSPQFEDRSDRLQHRHHESAFDDFARQPLLPFRRSQAGPGLAWFDLNNDTHLDLVIGTGRGGALEVRLGDGRGSFRPMTSAPDWTAPDDISTCLGYFADPTAPALLVGVSGYQVPGQAAVLEVRLQDDRLTFTPAVKDAPEVVGPLALGDLDGDGDLDLFVGGGCRPQHYPESVGSRLYRRTAGRWVLDDENTSRLKETGLVNGAVWSDLDGDSAPELVLACEWGPIRVFQNSAGELAEVTNDLGLGPYVGWWRGVATGDLDGDGRLDIVAANWGLNSPFRATLRQPLRLLYGDWLGAGRYDLLETVYAPDTGDLLPARDFNSLVPSLPFLYERYRSFRQFSESSVQYLLGEFAAQTRQVSANTLASMVFLNAQPRFRPVILPRAAQLAPASGVIIADGDSDGHEDVFLSQNFFAMRSELPRQDAGRGLWLRGDGRGQLAEVSGQDCGIQIYGEQRGAAIGDFDADGRMDIAVAQNGIETKLYRGARAAPAWRIRLQGRPENPQAIGAMLRLERGGFRGPVREIQAGSGYRSQNASVQLFGPKGDEDRVWIRWPGGVEETHELSPDRGDIQLVQPSGG